MKKNIWITITFINLFLVLYVLFLVKEHEEYFHVLSTDQEKYRLSVEKDFMDIRTSYDDLLNRYNEMANRLAYLESLNVSTDLITASDSENPETENQQMDNGVEFYDSFRLRPHAVYKSDYCKKARESGFLLASLGFTGLIAQKCGW